MTMNIRYYLENMENKFFAQFQKERMLKPELQNFL